jgi:CBS domain-containing protein
MLTVKQLLASKPQNAVYAVRPDHYVIDALELMATRNIGAVMVMSGEQLVGIFSERDYARKGILQDRKAKSTAVSEVMTPNVFTVHLGQNIEDCMRLMSEKKIRHLPVLDEGAVIGLLSVGDIVTAIMNEQKNRIESLEQYIMAG